MAKKISELDVATATSESDITPIVQDGVTKQITRLTSEYVKVNVGCNAVYFSFYNDSGRLAISEISFYKDGVLNTVSKTAGIVIPDGYGGTSGGSTIESAFNITGSFSNLFDGDPNTSVEFDIAGGSEVVMEAYLQVEFVETIEFDEVRIRAVSSGFTETGAPQYVSMGYSRPECVYELDDYTVTWTAGHEESFTINNMYVPKNATIPPSVDVHMEGKMYISNDWWGRIALPSGDTVLYTKTSYYLDPTLESPYFIDANTTLDTTFFVENASPATTLFFVDTTLGDVTVTLVPQDSETAKHPEYKYGRRVRKFINIGPNNMIISPSGFGEVISRGVTTTGQGGAISTYYENQYFIVLWGDTTTV